MTENPEQVLDDAIARNLGAVLSLPSAGMLRHHKSRFLEASADGIWIESVPEDRALVDELIARKQPAAISFKSATSKISFAATILRREEQHRINANMMVEAVLVARPAQIKSAQRRNDYRVRVIEAGELQARMWRIAEQADLLNVPPDAQELKINLRDISIGGMGMNIVPATPAEPGVETCAIRLLKDERLRIELRTGDQQMLIEGRVRHLPAALSDGKSSDGTALRVGVQFTNLANALQGRQALTTLTRIIGQLQREEVRRMRLGMTNGDATAA